MAVADEDDLGGLYDVQEPAAVEIAAVLTPADVPATDDDADLALALYGEVVEPAGPASEPERPAPPAAGLAPGALPPGTASLPPGTAPQGALPALVPAAAAAAETPQQAAEEEDSGDDDLMITLDENAASYEPQASRFQYQRLPGRPLQQQAEAVGAAPGQHMDLSEGPPTLAPSSGPAAFGARAAIGGIPRSAIPGLGPVTLQQPAAPAGPAPAPSPPSALSAAALALAAPRAPYRPARPALNAADAAFPSMARPDQPVKLPGQTRVSPEEYREFLALGHGEIFSIDIDMVVDAPWRLPGIDPSDFFNYQLNERGWKQYMERIKQYRLEFTMKGQIQTADHAARFRLRRRPEEEYAAMGGGGGTTGSGGGGSSDPQSLQMSREQQDSQYDAFVTSERPPRSQWARHGKIWEHVIVLSGADVNFDTQPTSIQAQMEAGVVAERAPPPPAPPARAPPGPPAAPRQTEPESAARFVKREEPSAAQQQPSERSSAARQAQERQMHERQVQERQAQERQMHERQAQERQMRERQMHERQMHERQMHERQGRPGWLGDGMAVALPPPFMMQQQDMPGLVGALPPPFLHGQPSKGPAPPGDYGQPPHPRDRPRPGQQVPGGLAAGMDIDVRVPDGRPPPHMPPGRFDARGPPAMDRPMWPAGGRMPPPFRDWPAEPGRAWVPPPFVRPDARPPVRTSELPLARRPPPEAERSRERGRGADRDRSKRPRSRSKESVADGKRARPASRERERTSRPRSAERRPSSRERRRGSSKDRSRPKSKERARESSKDRARRRGSSRERRSAGSSGKR